MRPIRPLVALALILALFVGCAALPTAAPPAPRNPAEAIAQAHVAVQEAAVSVAHLLDTKAMTATQASVCYDKLSQAEIGLLEARRLLSLGDPLAAEGQLALAEGLILAVRAQAGGAR